MRTDEQKTADEALHEAILACRRAYMDEPDNGILTEYVVVFASRYWDDDGDALTGVGTLVCDPAPPLHHQLGLYEYAAERLRHIICTDGDD